MQSKKQILSDIHSNFQTTVLKFNKELKNYDFNFLISDYRRFVPNHDDVDSSINSYVVQLANMLNKRALYYFSELKKTYDDILLSGAYSDSLIEEIGVMYSESKSFIEAEYIKHIGVINQYIRENIEMLKQVYKSNRLGSGQTSLRTSSLPAAVSAAVSAAPAVEKKTSAGLEKKHEKEVEKKPVKTVSFEYGDKSKFYQDPEFTNKYFNVQSTTPKLKPFKLQHKKNETTLQTLRGQLKAEQLDRQDDIQITRNLPIQYAKPIDFDQKLKKMDSNVVNNKLDEYVKYITSKYDSYSIDVESSIIKIDETLDHFKRIGVDKDESSKIIKQLIDSFAIDEKTKQLLAIIKVSTDCVIKFINDNIMDSDHYIEIVNSVKDQFIKYVHKKREEFQKIIQ